ncbi:autophagy-related protein 13 homolog [Sitodiplosis mosellana]|uniref:autophagy-related protein 13 homolog n=1 Tax=Sitodiplosis mosellana TaxID=263140 RepID=UPI0024440094|nr:autophagy-related protein 13 homolog [Sitodiplosis mosellana]
MNTAKTMVNVSPKMSNRDANERELEKYVKIFSTKAVQAIVQSRLGDKMQTFSNPRSLSNDWFNITIDDEPESLAQTKQVIETKSGESILTRLPLCVEISLKTADNDTMILEVWSLSCNRQLLDKTSRVSYSIYNRMGTLLKSLVQVTRSTPAYKLSRKKSMGCFDIFYRIYSGNPQVDNLGEGFKEHIIGDLSTSVGQFKMAVAYRTKMTISPTQTGRDTTLMLKSDHFNDISPKTQIRYHIKKTEKKVIDLEKPLITGAFVDPSKLTQYTEKDYILPEIPPFSWLIKNPKKETKNDEVNENDKSKANNGNIDCPGSPDSRKMLINNNNNNINNNKNLNNNNNNNNNVNANGDDEPKNGLDSKNDSLTKNDRFRFGSSKTLSREEDRILKEMSFPFATATPMKDLAKFYRDCFNAPPLHAFSEPLPPLVLNGDAVNMAAAEEIIETEANDQAADAVTKLLEQFETSLPDYETLVTSLCSHSIDKNSNS